MFTKPFIKGGRLASNFYNLASIFLIAWLILSIVTITPLIALAYPVNESGEEEEVSMDFRTMSRFLKDAQYARESICDSRLESICKEVWDILDCEAVSLGPLVLAVISVESEFDEALVGPDGDTGLMQVVPKWHKDRMERLEVDGISDLHQGLLVGADYLRELVGGYGDYGMALVHYNAGPSAVSTSHVPSSTKIYVKMVLERRDVIQEFLEKQYG